ncbi:hypothetical protein ACFYP4_33075 [Streptomyces sp. NPDC005551]|uniref:hypothetical protein n=1 Tax=unclassified Streptomyces TaxID=2593676 RepID=UPI0033E7868E
MRTIVAAVVLSAGCVLGGSAQAMAGDWGGQSDNDGNVSGCGIVAGAGGGYAYYAEGCLKIDRGNHYGDDEGQDDGRNNGHDDGRNNGHDSHDKGYAGMSDPLHLGGVQR